MTTKAPVTKTTSKPSSKPVRSMTEKEVKRVTEEEDWPDDDELIDDDEEIGDIDEYVRQTGIRESRKTNRQNGRTKSFRKSKQPFNSHKENDYNDCRFQGNLGKDPEINVTPNGTAVAKFSLAVWQGKDKDAMWLNCVAWEGLAEYIDTKFSKGDSVRVCGRMTQRKWEGKYYNDLVIDFIEKAVR